MKARPVSSQMGSADFFADVRTIFGQYTENSQLRLGSWKAAFRVLCAVRRHASALPFPARGGERGGTAADEVNLGTCHLEEHEKA